MAFNEKTGNYITPVGRLSFPVLVEPRAVGKDGKGDPKYQATLLFDEDAQDTDDFKDLKKAVKQAIKDKWGDNPPRKIKSPFLTVDDLRNKIPAGYEDEHVFIRLQSMVPVGCLLKTPGMKKPTALKAGADIKKEMYAGCQVKAAVNVYAWQHPEGGAGVSFGLSNLMKVDDDEPFGATNADPADDFGEDVDDEAADDFLD